MTDSLSMQIYLDNAATSFPKPDSVYDAVNNAMRNTGASPGRGGYGSSLAASRILLEARELLSGFFNLPDSSRMIFTSNTTMSINLALRGLLKSGDHVVTSSMEHNSLLRPLFMLGKQGVEFDIVQADSAGMIRPSDIRAAVRPNTRMIAIAHVSNVTGGIQPVEEISAIARDASALMLLDAAQSAGSLPIDMQAMGIDILAAPGHKGLLGPQGTGILAIMPGLKLKPIIAGGTGASSDMDDQPDHFPEGFEAGTHNLPGIAGLGAGVSFITQKCIFGIHENEKNCCNSLRQGLERINRCRVYGPADPEKSHGVLSITVNGFDPSEMAFFMDREFGISVRAGLHCAPRAHRTIGTYPSGTLRISPGWSTTRDDIDAFIDAIETITRRGTA